jgi:dynactin complex subunit
VPSHGTVHYFGETQFAAGIWVGIVLDHPKGKNDGCVDDVRYFDCAMNHGLFARVSKVSPLPADQDPLEMKYSTKELLGSLKVKIAKTMDALNRELEIAEEMEFMPEMKSREYASLVARLCEYCADEWNTLSDFKADVDRLCTF